MAKKELMCFSSYLPLWLPYSSMCHARVNMALEKKFPVENFTLRLEKGEMPENRLRKKCLTKQGSLLEIA
jgi:hypothetical protein